MDNTILTNVLLLVPSILCLLAIAKTIMLIKDNKLLSEQLTEATIILQKKDRLCQKLKQNQQKNSAFQKTLNNAELTTQLQSPRLQNETLPQQGLKQNRAPEKYRFIHSLAEKGMDVTEIASTLSISSRETEQIIRLRRLTQE